LPLLIQNATLLSLSPRSIRRGHLLIDEGQISAPDASLRTGDYEVFDAGGRVVMPGNVCAHTHLYSALARGMPPPPRIPTNFPEILEYIWWRLDRALDEDSIRSSAAVGAIDALKAGTTTVIDHHASPSCIEGSLDMLGEELSRVGIRGVLCYEVTDRNGSAGRKEGIRENRRFAADGPERFPLMRALFGAHASFTLDEDSLEEIAGSARDLGVGVHIHAAEDLCDQTDSLRRCGQRVAQRLDRHGVLTDRVLLAHGVHLDGPEIQLLGARRAWLAHNCRSNLNNSVGRAPMGDLMKVLGERLTMGTDGIDEDMFGESRTAYFRLREQSLEGYAEQVTDILSAGGKLAGKSFGRSLGTLDPGAVADLVVLDYEPPTPLTTENLAWHWMFAFSSQLVRDVMVQGRWVVRDRALVNVDEEAVRAQATEQAAGLWRRMEVLPV